MQSCLWYLRITTASRGMEGLTAFSFQYLSQIQTLRNIGTIKHNVWVEQTHQVKTNVDMELCAVIVPKLNHLFSSLC